jgi:hypothetical protein
VVACALSINPARVEEDVTPRVYRRGWKSATGTPESRDELSQREDMATSKKDASLAAKQLANPESTKAQKSVAASDLAQAKKKGGGKK